MLVYAPVCLCIPVYASVYLCIPLYAMYACVYPYVYIPIYLCIPIYTCVYTCVYPSVKQQFEYVSILFISVQDS